MAFVDCHGAAAASRRTTRDDEDAKALSDVQQLQAGRPSRANGRSA